MFIINHVPLLNRSLHGFCNSSTIAYAAVVYAKVRTNLGVSVSLMVYNEC